MKRILWSALLLVVGGGCAWNASPSPGTVGVHAVGVWPLGPSRALALDTVRSLVFLGSGGVIRVLDVAHATPTAIGEIQTGGTVEDLAYDPLQRVLYVAAGRAGVEVWGMSDPAHPLRIKRLSLPGHVGHLVLSGALALVANDNGVRVLDISAPVAAREVGADTFPGEVKGVGLRGRYAYVGCERTGLYILDLSHPEHPRLASHPSGTPVKSLWIHKNRAFVIREGGIVGSWLEVLDLSDPLDPRTLGTFPVSDLAGDVFASEHHAYVAFGEIQILDVSDPAAPREVGIVETPGMALRVRTWENRAFVADAWGGLRILDVTDPAAPVEVGFFPGEGDARGVAVSGPTAFLATGSGGLRMLDLSRLDHPMEVDRYGFSGSVEDVFVAGDLVLVSVRSDGLRIAERSGTSLREVGAYPLSGWVQILAVQDGSTLIATEWGVVVLDISDPAAPRKIGEYVAGGVIQDGVVVGNRGYLIVRGRGLVILDVSDPAAPVEVGTWGRLQLISVAASGSHAWVADSAGKIHILNVEDPGRPRVEGVVESGDAVRDLAVAGTYLWVGGETWIQVLDISDPVRPREVGASALPAPAARVVMAEGYEGYGFVAEGMAGLQIFRVFP